MDWQVIDNRPTTANTIISEHPTSRNVLKACFDFVAPALFPSLNKKTQVFPTKLHWTM